MDKQEDNQPQPVVNEQPSSSSPPDSSANPVEPLSPPPFEPAPESPLTLAPKPKKKGLVIGLIVAAVLLVLVGGSALAYNLWYQNPEKVVTDSMMNAIKAKSIKYTGSLVVAGGQEARIEINGRGAQTSNELNAKATFKYNEKNITLEGSVITDDKGDLYFKVKNIDTIINEYRDAQDSTELKGLIDTVVAKVNNQWIKVNADDLKSVSESTSESQKCFTEAAKKIKEDKSISSEIADTYKAHKFIVIDDKLGSKDGSLGYKLSLDKSVAKNFVREVKNTKLYKQMQDCDKGFKIDENDLFAEQKDSDGSKTRVELWVSRFSHQATKLKIESTKEKDNVTFLFEPTFDVAVDTIKAPAKSTTIKQLQSDIQALLESAMRASSDSASRSYDEAYKEDLST